MIASTEEPSRIGLDSFVRLRHQPVVGWRYAARPERRVTCGVGRHSPTWPAA